MAATASDPIHEATCPLSTPLDENTPPDACTCPFPVEDSDSDLPTLTSDLTLDTDRLNELSLFTPKPKARTVLEISPSTPSSTAALLSRGQFLKYKCSARLSSTTFGTYDSLPACRILLSLIFHASDTAQFRWARITVDVDSDASIAVFAPELRHGKPVSKLMKTTLSAGASITLPTPGVLGGAKPALLAGRTQTSERVKTSCWKMEGSAEDWDPTTGVEWTITENKVDPDGLPARPKVGVVVLHGGEKFTLKLKLAATTRSGLPIVCEKMPGIVFDPGNAGGEGRRMKGLVGGRVGIGEAVFVGESGGVVFGGAEELEGLTQF